MLISNYIRIVLLVFVVLPLQGICAEREDEIREKMWGSPGEGFEVSDIPKKWADKSAVFIARLNHFEYKKPPILNVLKFNEYNHYRIKLLDKSAIENYAEISYMNSMAVAGLGTKIYVGIKVIKPDGREVIVDLSNAVKMEQKAGLSSKSYNKIAIPDLQPGDILDYYICEESVFPNSSEIYFFDPVLFHLPQRYPVMKQKLQFNVQRRCFINLKSLNGAPELKLVDDVENDEQYYLLEDNDREALEETRWLYPYRELPSVKFRASYASGKGIRRYGVLLGEPGIVKSSVDKQELVDLTHTLLTTTISNFYELSKYAKTELKGMEEKD
ncbi:MAG: DUF3857 domain-containing protein, partial [Cyclobacteriaceae bacterium]|nr:DUF3857 domain-containing protein [Cyclobacteriaceae bacterium]